MKPENFQVRQENMMTSGFRRGMFFISSLQGFLRTSWWRCGYSSTLLHILTALCGTGEAYHLKRMNNQLNFNALLAWTAFGAQDYSGLERHGREIYNYFVHNPREILKLGNPLLIGKIFQVCLGFQELDKDIQEERAENAFICFSQAL